MQVDVADPSLTGEAAELPVVRPMTAIEIQQHEDAQWAASASEVQQHVGKFVAVRNRRVIAVGTDHRTVIE